MSAPLRVGFVRGVAPTKWARRWAEAARDAGWPPLALEAFDVSPNADAPGSVDIVLERVAPGRRPDGVSEDQPTRLAVRLYEEAVALVVDAEHELADLREVDAETLGLVRLMAHPVHMDGWPAADPWDDPEWEPPHAEAVLDLVAAGSGAALLPLPLARHLSTKRKHAVVPIADSVGLVGTTIWASWAVDRDDDTVQRFIGILRGRTARSSRSADQNAAQTKEKPGRSTTQRSARPATAGTRKRRTYRSGKGRPRSRS